MSYVIALQAPAVLGYRFGLRQPAQLIRLRICPLAPAVAQPNWPAVDDWLSRYLDVPVQHCPAGMAADLRDPDAIRALGWFWRILLTASTLLRLGGVPVFDPGKVLAMARDPQAPGGWHGDAAIAQVDYFPDAVTVQAFEAAAILVLGLTSNPAAFSNPEPLCRQLESVLIGPLVRAHATDPTTLAILQAADAADIPWRHQGHGIYQLGWGRLQHRLRGSHRASDSSIGVSVAQDKSRSAQWLRRAGLPVPEHAQVHDVEAAVAAARRYWNQGASVVLKPACSIGDEGVTLDIRSEAQVRAAYPRAAAVSPAVLIERQVAGLVHHVQLLGDQMLYVLRRQSVAVQGDGRHTIAELVAKENQRRQAIMLWRRPPPLPFDAAARTCLARAGYTPEHVLAAGDWAPLREIPTNVDGGRDEDVTKLIHPDNVTIAVHAARQLRLGMAGVDIISPDITVPWHVNGAVINEINHAPMLGRGPASTAAMPALVSRLLGGTGRIPIEVIVGDRQALAHARKRQQAWVKMGVACFMTAHDVTEDPRGALRPMACSGTFYRTRALLTDRRVGAIVVALESNEWLETGLPVDRLTYLEVGGGALHNEASLTDLEHMLRPYLVDGFRHPDGDDEHGLR